MKIRWLLKGATLGFLFFCKMANATDLMDVYRDALCSDPTYQQAIAQRLANREAVPISMSNLLPALSGVVSPSITKNTSSGSATDGSPSTVRGYNYSLTLTQTIFNFANFANVAEARATAKQADATLNAAAQDLMIRVAAAYFRILQDEDDLLSSDSNKTAFAKALDQIKQQFKVGLKTITDVYTAQASFDQASAEYITVQTRLQDDKENLRAITGKIYPHLATLNEKFPLISPMPADIDAWTVAAQKQNWSVKSAQYAADAARMNIKQQFGGHLPTLNVQAQYGVNYTETLGTTSVFILPGTSQIHSKSVQLNLNVPLVQGGLVVAQTHQAQYQYQAAIQQMEQQLRAAINTTRQSYLGVISGISKIEADKQTVKSLISSLEGMRAGYAVGTEILVNVLNQQQKVFGAKVVYARDRYEYVNNLLTLKQATGTLSPQDLQSINAWLNENRQEEEPAPRFIPKPPSSHCVVRKKACPKPVVKRHHSTHRKHIST